MQIVYDGECPFCRRFVTLYRARSVVGEIELIDARDDHPAVRRVRSLGYGLDEGMVVTWADHVYHGADAINFMAMVGAQGDIFNALNKLIFRVRPLARLLYPVMVAVRSLTLRLLGRKRIGDSGRT